MVSHIAAIVDIYGGCRVVVAHKDSFKYHLRPDELLFVVPGKTVREPIAWNDIPIVVRLGEMAVEGAIERGLPNEPGALWALKMYQLRCLENQQYKGSLDLDSIVTT